MTTPTLDLVARLERMARDAKQVTHTTKHVHETRVPGVVGFVYDDLMEAARLIRESEAALATLRAKVADAAAEHLRDNLRAFADRAEKAEPYLRGKTITKWCRDMAADMREVASK